MITAHLPASFLITKFCIGSKGTKFQLLLGILAGIAPDFDLVYFYTIDNRQHLHHGYFTHIPAYIGGGLIITILINLLIGKRILTRMQAIVFLNLFLHCFLDTIAGGIKWFYPFSEKYIFFFTVPAYLGPSIWNFFLHWTFALEVMIWIVTVATYRKSVGSTNRALNAESRRLKAES